MVTFWAIATFPTFIGACTILWPVTSAGEQRRRSGKGREAQSPRPDPYSDDQPRSSLRSVTQADRHRCANSRRYTGDRRSPKPFGRITQDTRVILARFSIRYAEMI